VQQKIRIPITKKRDSIMTYQRLTADTAISARQVINQAINMIDDALRERFPEMGSASRPLRMTIHLAVKDLDGDDPELASQYAETGYKTMQANTVQEARAILDQALRMVAVESAARPACRRYRNVECDRQLRIFVHFDLDDLDREDSPHVSECLHLPYDRIPAGLQPHNTHPEHRLRDRRSESKSRDQGRLPLRRWLLGGS
jgi:hypothetical protein